MGRQYNQNIKKAPTTPQSQRREGPPSVHARRRRLRMCNLTRRAERMAARAAERMAEPLGNNLTTDIGNLSASASVAPAPAMETVAPRPATRTRRRRYGEGVPNVIIRIDFGPRSPQAQQNANTTTPPGTPNNNGNDPVQRLF